MLRLIQIWDQAIPFPPEMSQFWGWEETGVEIPLNLKNIYFYSTITINWSPVPWDDQVEQLWINQTTKDSKKKKERGDGCEGK
jgi:hypothetical protein